MLQELTIEYNINNYLEAIDSGDVLTYSLEGYGEFPSTLYIRDSSQNERLALIREKSHAELGEGWSKLAKL